MVVVTIEIRNKLEEYKKGLDALLTKSRLWTSDTEEEKIRILKGLMPPVDKLLLYRYYRLDTNGYVLSDLRNGKITLCAPSLFNDPYDSLIFVDRNKVREAQRAYTVSNLVEDIKSVREGGELETYDNSKKGLIKSLAKSSIALDQINCNENIIEENTSNTISWIVRNLKQQIRVACFSEESCSPIMWAHYADSGRGFCVEYEVPIAQSILFGASDGTCSFSLLPVLYSEKRYDATHIAEDQLSLRFAEALGCLNNIDTSNIDLLYCIKMALYKSLNWSYEQEWRLIAFPLDENWASRISIPMQMIKSVIFGNAMLNPQIEQVLDALRTRTEKTGEKIELKRLVLDTDSQDYSLTTVPFTNH